MGGVLAQLLRTAAHFALPANIGAIEFVRAVVEVPIDTTLA